MPQPDALAAALLTLAEHTGQLSALEARQAASAGDASARITAIETLMTALKDTLADQGAILTGLAGQIGDNATGPDPDGPAGEREPSDYQPCPQPRFWQPGGHDREQAIDRLRAWVEQVYRPGYGQIAASLGACWEQHPLCLYTLDWLSELWSALYLQPRRTASTLAGQAEWQTRLLTAAADQMARETARCGHARPGRPARIGARP